MPRKMVETEMSPGRGIVPENTVCIDAAKFGPFDDVRFRNGVTVLVEDVVKMDSFPVWRRDPQGRRAMN